MKPTDSPRCAEILLLEDEPSDAYLVKIALQESQLLTNLHHVVDGREGLDFLNRTGGYLNARRPDLIFLDLNMPRMSGYEFLVALRSDDRFKAIPVVVLTTADFEQDTTGSYLHGVTRHVTKPMNKEVFIRLISGYWFNQGGRS
jgi:CheY-like chemotaxis protein